MRRMPHTVHLAAIKLLEGVRAISKAEGKRAAARSRNYQDNVTTPLTHEHDDDATANDEIDEDSEAVQPMDPDTNIEAANGVLPAIERLWKIVKAVRSSPQHCQAWAREIQFIQGSRISDNCSAPLC
ncbi:hypothetical protein BYT27DRAFT_7270048 [Phlegmacium glaucopus]|nr:hypothetical protein BYT27DRAFT_7270048 [Phlegmacium glaucopus]